MRILFTSCPAYGHVNPMLPLAQQARLAGHDVAFATGAELAPEVERRNFETWLVGPSHAEADASVRAAHPNLADLPSDQRMQVRIEGVFVESAAKRAVELVPRAQQWRPDIVVHEITELAGALAAAHTGARHVVHGLGPHTLLLPRCDLVVSHGGAGIMLGALAHGLPQLILPQGADQFMNAAACQNARVALALSPDELSAEAVAAAAGRLITEPGFEAAAAHIGAEIGAMPTAADVLASDLLRAKTDDHVPA